MALCKYCNAKIEWLKDNASGRNYPVNMDGSRHDCRTQQPQRAQVPTQTPGDLVQRRILWCWAVGQSVSICEEIGWHAREIGDTQSGFQAVLDPDEKLKWIETIAERLVRFVDSKTT